MSTKAGKKRSTFVVNKSFRLVDYHLYDGLPIKTELADSESGSGSDQELEQKKRTDDNQFIVQMFGVNERGETCCIYVEDYQPFFYVKVGDQWTQSDMYEFLREIQKKVAKQFHESILSVELIDRYKLYGFSGGQQHKFVKITFKNTAVMNKVKNLWFSYSNTGEDEGGMGGERKRIKFIFNKTNIELYESNIPPLLRCFHIHNISPSGWVNFKSNRACKITNPTTTCNYEYVVSIHHLQPMPEKEVSVPYKICSFDIEASSSHGDFPVPIKTYKRLAANAVDVFYKQASVLSGNIAKCKTLFRKIVLTAFGYDHFEDIDVVYPKQLPSKKKVNDLVDILLEKSIEIAKRSGEVDQSYILTIDAMFEQMRERQLQDAEGTGGGGEEEGGEEGGFESSPIVLCRSIKVDSDKTIVDVLLSAHFDRDEHIQILNDVMTRLFPSLEGDKITFIGSTFLKYGTAEPYLNHCLVLGSCDEVDGAVIETVETESDVLLRWTELIQKENPDIVIGYNIFGFDYEFMFRRAQENQIERDFLKLSRKIGEFCAKTSKDTGELLIENTKMKIASGEYDLRYFKMTGRLQIDMYAYFKRDFNLSSYKLDDVAGEFISDTIKKVIVTSEGTELYSQNLMGLHEGDYIHIGFVGFTDDYYKGGKKFRVISIEKGREEAGSVYNVLTIAGEEHIPMDGKPIKWTMAKDDVTPQDIFRLANGSSADRAIVAKYCIQDCNLVHHLMNKIDVLTGYVEMARICSVPISFLVFRGQGIKLTSFVAKKCREKGTLMPDLEKTGEGDGYEGAIVLPPKCAMYMDNPVACVDYSSLYPSSMISQNFSHDSKVWTKEFDLTGKLVGMTGERNKAGEFVYDNLPGHDYIDLEFDTFKYIRKTPKARAIKTKCGTKICRWAQFPDNKKGIMPSILEELLRARKETRNMIKTEKDPFMQNILDKRQLGYKVTANSLYGQCGSRTSTFYDKDVAAATTATGRMMIIYAKRIIEEVYGDRIYQLESGQSVKTKAEYIYGDSVANYTPVYVKASGQFDICTIEQLSEKYGNNGWTTCVEEGKQEKEFCELFNVETWSDKGWTKLHRVIRHALAPHKKMIRILTHTGLVDVTDDHSLVKSNGEMASPKDVSVGTELLHHSLPSINTSTPSITEEEAKVLGFFFGDGSCGSYDCPSGKKSSWALNNACPNLMNKYLDLCKVAYSEFEWVIADTIESSGVCKIIPKSSKYGSIVDFVNKTRTLMYSEKSKIIPVIIMQSSEPVRQAFWEGLYDADGDKDSNGYVRIDQKNQISASQIAWLACSLGWKTSINTRLDKPNIYRITMTKKTQRKNTTAIKKIHEIDYSGYVYDLTTDNHHFAAGIGNMIVHNTDSVFFTFNLENPDTGEKVVGKPALEMTIEIAQDAADLCTQWLKPPMELSYEKTLMPFILLSKKRYVGMLYETNPNKGKLKFMGLSIKRRDSCDYLKDVYGQILNILMDTKNTDTIRTAIDYLDISLKQLVDGQVSMDKLAITKALRSDYKNPLTIGHKVLADRIGKRDPGNKPKPGDRMKFVFIVNNEEGSKKKLLMGDKIETPEYILEHNLQVDYTHYITNQLMKPLQQLFGLALEQIWEYQNKRSAIKAYRKDIDEIQQSSGIDDLETFMKNKEKYCSKKVKTLLFDKVLTQIANKKNNIQTIMGFFPKK
jgi:DNA polymerase elongation subunit (family B)